MASDGTNRTERKRIRPFDISGPEADDSEHRSVFLGSVFNLSNSVLAGGISLIPLPYCVKISGLTAMPVILAISGVLAVLTAVMLVRVSVVTGATTYHVAAGKAIGPWGATAVQVVVMLNNFGVCVAFLDVFGDVIPSMLPLGREWLVIIVGALLLPVVARVKTIEELSRASAFATGCCALFFVMVVVKGIQAQSAPATPPPAPSPSGSASAAVEMHELLRVVSVITMSWVCHFNVLPIFRGVVSATRRADNFNSSAGI